jgi:hypothetical protein
MNGSGTCIHKYEGRRSVSMPIARGLRDAGNLTHRASVAASRGLIGTQESVMPNKVALVTAVAIGTAAMTTGATTGTTTAAMALDQGGGVAKRSGHWTRAGWHPVRHAWRA